MANHLQQMYNLAGLKVRVGKKSMCLTAAEVVVKQPEIHIRFELGEAN